MPSFAWMSWWVCSMRQSTKTDCRQQTNRKKPYISCLNSTLAKQFRVDFLIFCCFAVIILPDIKFHAWKIILHRSCKRGTHYRVSNIKKTRKECKIPWFLRKRSSKVVINRYLRKNVYRCRMLPKKYMQLFKQVSTLFYLVNWWKS